MSLHIDWSAAGKDSTTKFQAALKARGDVAGSGADLTPLKNKVTDVTASYRREITAVASKWTGIQPDFRKPLLDALDAIDARVAAP